MTDTNFDARLVAARNSQLLTRQQFADRSGAQVNRVIHHIVAARSLQPHRGGRPPTLTGLGLRARAGRSSRDRGHPPKRKTASLEAPNEP